jgi:predicted short-subunit dehydrogenase-like oxidoreductase (DUF2520 family)
MALHLRTYFRHLHLSFNEWDRSQDPHLLASKIDECTHVLLAVSDNAIAGVYQRYVAGHDKVAVHFSGALSLPGMIAAHPLMSFGKETYTPEFYQKIHFTLSGCEDLQAALPGLPNPFSILPEEQKPLYHALCVMGGNFTTLLLRKMLTELARMDIPAAAAQLYTEKIVQNVFANPEGALTGPLARQDAETVARNLEALNHDPYQKIYGAFLQAHWPSYPEKSHEHS